MSTERVFIPIYQFRLNSIITYCIPDRPFKCTDKSKENLTGRKSSKGVVTDGMKKRITKIVTLLIMSTPTKKVYNPIKNIVHDFKLGFLTLTMPKQKEDLTAKETNKKLLSPMLLYMKRRFALKSYIWKLEYQKNGTIHYHITVDCFMDYTLVRQKWNEILNQNGLLADFKAKYNHSNPNSIDIHSVKKIENIEAYLVKYLSKNDQSKQSNSKIWDASENLKRANYFTIVPESKHYAALENRTNSQTVEVVKKDNFHIYKFKTGKPTDILTKSELAEMRQHLKDIRK